MSFEGGQQCRSGGSLFGGSRRRGQGREHQEKRRVVCIPYLDDGRVVRASADRQRRECKQVTSSLDRRPRL